jgi:type IV pilus assembly protein PilN
MLINLLPHRTWALDRQRKNFATALALAALLGLALAAGLSVWLGHQLDIQKAANQRLTVEITSVDLTLKKIAQANAELVQLNLRVSLLDSWRLKSKMSAFWLQEVADILPDSLYLTALKQDGDKVSIQGVARSNEQVFELLRRIASEGKWLAQAELIEVTQAPLSTDALALTGTPFAMRALLRQAEPPASDGVPAHSNSTP